MDKYIADSSTVRRLASGRWQYVSTGRFALERNGEPIREGLRRDRRGRIYDPEQRRSTARKNFAASNRARASARVPGHALADSDLRLWPGPPRPLERALYLSVGEILRLVKEEGDETKRAALTAWADAHARPSLRRSIMGYWLVTVAAQAQAWATFTLVFFERDGEWVLDGASPISDVAAESSSHGRDKREKGPSSSPRDELHADRTSVHIPIRRIPKGRA